MWDKSDWNAASREDSVLFRVRAGGYGALFEALDDCINFSWGDERVEIIWWILNHSRAESGLWVGKDSSDRFRFVCPECYSEDPRWAVPCINFVSSQCWVLTWVALRAQRKHNSMQGYGALMGQWYYTILRGFANVPGKGSKALTGNHSECFDLMMGRDDVKTWHFSYQGSC